ncbi:hypothetical protein ACFC1R_31165 [Kitasatospora sp. NPDC056138]|uniref:hypothetical protein n=1 Tax=Kitasatospora sp. NPDC056138 TaxID=3345724 RepID=UPI0035E39944
MLTATRTRPTAGAAAHAQHIVRLTRQAAPQGWAAPAAATAETPLGEDQEFAAQVAALTGTDPQLWLATALDSSATYRRLLAQGADAIVATDASIELVLPAEVGDDWAELEAEIANEAAADAALEAAADARTRATERAARRERIRELALEEYSEAELAAFGDDPLDAWSRHEREQVKKWSPFRNGRRWSETPRALSGPAAVRD